MNAPAALPIGELARQSGFSPDTLRYYERLGLVPPPGRTESGRRAYDSRSLERLRFIARAKELGCTLDEIASLVTAFDDDCGDVQAPLRDLVDAKIADSERRIVALTTFTTVLREARHALSTQAIEGPCGPDCACLGQPTEHRGAAAAVSTSAPEPAIACTLDPEDMGARGDEWRTLLAGVTPRTTIQGGLRLALGADTDLADVARLAVAEWACCSFFAFAITVDGRGTALEVRAPEAAQEVMANVFGDAA